LARVDCAMKAWEGRKRCNEYITETFRWNPVGSQSHPVEPGKQPEASLAPAVVTQRTKRRQLVLRPCHGAPRLPYPRFSSRCSTKRGPRPTTTSLVFGYRRGLRTRHRHTRVPQEHGTPCDSTVFAAGGAAAPNAPGRQAGVGPERSEDRRQRVVTTGERKGNPP